MSAPHGSKTWLLKKNEVEIVEDATGKHRAIHLLVSGVHYDFNNLKQIKKDIAGKGYQGIYLKTKISGGGEYIISPNFF